jgi:alginate O-acetyltransferase complex protein AlgI
MLFNSLPFLYAFLPITYVVFWQLRSRQQRYVWLTLTGYVFYGFWNYKFCAIMAGSTLVSYLAGLGMLRWREGPARRACLVVPIVIDLALLGFFKYADFGIDNLNAVSVWLGRPLALDPLRIVLPIGISFYTFHTITYIVDSYRGVVTPTRNLFEFSCYVSLFAQLVAGPIVRFRQIERDLDDIDHADRRVDLDAAWSFFAIGLAKKVLVADSLARLIDPVIASAEPLATLDAWLVMLGYTYQLYFDFSGYSDMAVGLGLMFGLRLPQNFNSPYKAVDPADFWRRWHISLSTVLRDYLYIPLGGSRFGTLATYRNLMITMLLGGLWHGAAWTFVIWGAYHGALLCLTRAAGQRLEAVPVLARQVGTFLLVVIGWVFFRAPDLPTALRFLRSMLTPASGEPLADGLALLAALVVAGVIAHTMPNTFELRHRPRPALAVAMTGMVALCLLVMYTGNATPFLYFQF